jgi:uncharacterized protein (TIGR00725 family)
MNYNGDIHTFLKNAFRIGVFGSDGEHCTPEAERIAYDVGRRLAQAGTIIYTGGAMGVMGAACKGAREGGGISISISPWGDSPEDRKRCNPDSTIVIPTGIGYARCQVLVNSVDGAIAIAGGVGTLAEIGEMYLNRKPVVAIETSGGIAEKYSGTVLDGRNLDAILSAENAEQAVALVLQKVAEKRPRIKARILG